MSPYGRSPASHREVDREVDREPLEIPFLHAVRSNRPRRVAPLPAGLLAALLVAGSTLACVPPRGDEAAGSESGVPPRGDEAAGSESGAPAGQETAGEETAVARAEAPEEKRGLFERFFGPEEEQVVVPAGTVLQVSLGETLSSHDTAVGERFDAVVLQDVAVDGVVAIPAGARLAGQVTEAMPARKIGGRARLSLAFDALDLGDREVPVVASIVRVGKSERAKDAAIIGGSTIAGAVLGEEIDDGDGGVIGAIVGGLAGTAAAKKTHGKPIVLEAGTELSVRLEGPIEVTVAV
ncbi:MAG TPA: hypothetical protein VMV46_15370, partial [Thermoanaerobaculia bacterium]|nr:hypothetical protein [Thermoanaerobaculia bacterium]